jgi:menaquinol-cytochrome c reductase iron-sulfur subunit
MVAAAVRSGRDVAVRRFPRGAVGEGTSRLWEVAKMQAEGSSDVSRRGFLGWMTGLLVLLGVLFNAVPFVGALVSKPAGGKKEDFVPVGPVSGLTPLTPVNLTFSDVEQDAYIKQTVTRNVWVVKQPTGAVTVFSPICPHLGCQYTWDAAGKHFICPCHTSIFTIEGAVVSGPAPRPLDTLPSRVDNGTLLVKWVQYKLATPVKQPIG